MELQTNHGEERLDRRKDTAVEAVLEQLIEQGPGDIAGVFARAFELAMQIERTPERRGYANLELCPKVGDGVLRRRFEVA